EAIYAMLHVTYKYQRENPTTFFRNNNWRIGHFLESLCCVVDLIKQGNLSKKKMNFYVRLIKARTSSDELRLLFYYITSTENLAERKRLIELFNSLNFFDSLRDDLIIPTDKELLS